MRHVYHEGILDCSKTSNRVEKFADAIQSDRKGIIVAAPQKSEYKIVVGNTMQIQPELSQLGPETIRRERVRQLWKARPPEERTYEIGPLNFYKWLVDHNLSELLPPGQGDPYQRLRTELLQDGLLEGETQKEAEKKTEKETKK